MDRNEAAVSELSAEVAGQKLSLKSVALNTLATVATLILVVVIAVLLHQHQQDAKVTGEAFVSAVKEQTGAIKEQTSALRENTCIAAYQGPASERASFCKQVSR